jgi:hypothetical protein
MKLMVVSALCLTLVAASEAYSERLYDPSSHAEKTTRHNEHDAFERRARSSTLKGIKRVRLQISVIKNASKESDEMSETLTTLVKEKFADAGIVIVDEFDSKAPVVRLSGAFSTEQVNAVSGFTDVSLYQPVVTQREPGLSFTILTWRRSRDVSGRSELDIVNMFAESVNSFLLDWLSVNKRDGDSKSAPDA